MNVKIVCIFLSFAFSTAFSMGSTKIDAEKIYKSNCRICHGSKGDLGISGATNLITSKLNKAEISEVIVQGRGLMTPFKDVLSEDEIKALSKYVYKLQK